MFSRNFSKINFETLIYWVPSLNFVFWMSHKILQSETLKVFLFECFRSYGFEFARQNLLLDALVKQCASKLIGSIIIQNQKLGKFLCIEDYPITYIIFINPAINSSDMNVFSLLIVVTLSHPHAPDILPLVVDIFVNVIQFHTSFTLTI